MPDISSRTAVFSNLAGILVGIRGRGTGLSPQDRPPQVMCPQVKGPQVMRPRVMGLRV
jgi:hypothetical protein